MSVQYTGDVQYTGRISLSTPGDIIEYSGGYHEYTGGCSVYWGMFSILRDVQYTGVSIQIQLFSQ